MKITVISTMYPYPQNCGKAKVMGGILQYFLRKEAGNSVRYIHVAKHPAKHDADTGFEYIHLPGPSLAETLGNVVSRGLLRWHSSLQECFTYSRSTRRALHEHLEATKPDLVFLDTIRVGQYFEWSKRPDLRYFLYLDDLFSVRYERILGALGHFDAKDLDPLGNFAAFIPSFLRPLAEKHISLRCLLGFEMRRIRAREDAIVHRFERSFLINPQETELLRQRSQCATVLNLPLLSRMREHPLRCQGTGNHFVFLGDLKLAHNHASVLRIAAIADRLRGRLPDHRVLIIGKGARPDLLEALKAHPNIEYKGYVEDLDQVLAGARAMLAPLPFGSGIKIKCIDALSIGLPIIGSDCGVEGLGLEHNEQCLIIDTGEELLEAMVSLTKEPQFTRISSNSLAHYRRNYAPESVLNTYHHLLQAG